MNNQRLTTILLIAVVILLSGGSALIIKNSSKHGRSMGMTNTSSTDALLVSIQTAEEQNGELGVLENSWPGEIISFGDVLIQPRREGTIVEWNVNIGQRVRRGQTIAKLSAPPAMPELISMLAEQTKMLTEARVDTNAQIRFAEKRKQQLATLLSAIENNNTVLQAKNAVAADKQKIRAALEQGISKEIQLFSNVDVDITSFYRYAGIPILYLKDSLGHLNRATHDVFVRALTNAVKEIGRDGVQLETIGAEYFQAAAKMVAATSVGDDVSADQLMEMRKMVFMDQMAFLDAVKDYNMSRTELAKMETDYAMQTKDIEEQIAMLEKDIAMNEGNVAAALASYNTVAGSINGDLAIISPADGVISSVMKKNGDFVEPGMAIASVNTGKNTDQFVRFRIPSNLRLPESGTELMIVRPGFPKEAKRVKLIGVGTSLDGNGSYLADAKFVDMPNWPVNISVRVLAADNSVSKMFVNIGSLEWDEKGASIWVVRNDNTIKKQSIKTGRTLGENVEIFEGLAPGDRYITKLVAGLNDGIAVREGESVGIAKISDEGHGHDN